MTNNNNNIEKFAREIKNAFEMSRSKQQQKEYNNEIAKKTWHYQKKYGFETSPRKGHEFWNNEADAFKHSFGSADMYFKYGNLGSLLGGINHELSTPKNPINEWNMDSWNNNQGREIAREIKKEYGEYYYNLPKEYQDNIIAQKVIDRMNNGQLITTPNDQRKYTGIFENLANIFNNLKHGATTGQAIPYTDSKPFTPTEISKMTPEEFKKNEIKIMNELKKGQIRYEVAKEDWANFKNPQSGENMVYTREDIAKMSANEYTKNEKEINAQLKTIGVPYNRDLPKNIQTYGKLKTYKNNSATSSEGRWVTINGNHVLIKD